MSYILHIGNKRYSSWSLRGWLLLEAFGLSFEEEVAPMYTAAFEEMQRRIAPGRQVPTLEWRREDGQSQMIWDSLAIAEFLAERHPEAGHWPADPAARALARCLTAEMHSGFSALRGHMPMNIGVSYPGFGRGPGVAADVARLESLWAFARERYGAGGPYLFGAAYTAADAFFTPVAYRAVAYGLEFAPAAAEYAEALRAHPAAEAWRQAAEAEIWVEPWYNFIKA